MFKLVVVVVFGVMAASAVVEDTSRSKLSKYAELSKPPNQGDQTVTDSFASPVIDSLTKKRTKDQRTQYPLKRSLTNHSCQPSVERSVKALYENEDSATSRSVSVQRKEESDQDRNEETVEVERSHSRGKREATNPKSLLDDWTDVTVKVPYTSHIYLGESLYPYVLEESRVLQTDSSQPSSGENRQQKEVRLTETRHKKEEEVPVQEITKIYEIK